MPRFTIPIHEHGTPGDPNYPHAKHAKGSTFPYLPKQYRDAQHEYQTGLCWVFALAVHQETKWPMVAVYNPDEGVEYAPHVVLRHPSGQFVDSRGFVTQQELQKLFHIKKFAQVTISEERLRDDYYNPEDGELRSAAKFWSILQGDHRD